MRQRTSLLLALVAGLAGSSLLLPARAEVDHALLTLQVTDTEGWGLPGVICWLQSDSDPDRSSVGLTSMTGRCTLVAKGGETSTLHVQLEGFQPLRFRGVDLAAGHHYRLPHPVPMEVADDDSVAELDWHGLVEHGVAPDLDALEEWLEEQPDQVAELLARPAHLRVQPLSRALRVLLRFQLYDEGWEGIVGATIALRDEAGRVTTRTYAEGGCELVLDRPGTYSLEIAHPLVAATNITGCVLEADHVYSLELELPPADQAPQTLAWDELIAEHGVDAATFAGEWVELGQD